MKIRDDLQNLTDAQSIAIRAWNGLTQSEQVSMVTASEGEGASVRVREDDVESRGSRYLTRIDGDIFVLNGRGRTLMMNLRSIIIKFGEVPSLN